MLQLLSLQLMSSTFWPAQVLKTVSDQTSEQPRTWRYKAAQIIMEKSPTLYGATTFTLNSAEVGSPVAGVPVT